MAVPFKQIPENLLVPGHYQEVDNSLAGSVSEVKKALMIGYMRESGTAEPGKPVNILSADKARTLFGFGSPAAIMAAEFLKRNTIEELWVLPIPEAAGATAWKKTFTAAVTQAVAGAVTITINGVPYSAAVEAGASAGQVAAAVVAAINAEVELPVEAEVDEGNEAVFSVSACVKGAVGNDNTVAISSATDGVTITEGAVTQGTGVTNLEDYLAGLGEVRYNFFASDFSDAANIQKCADELESRYSAMRQIGGRMYVAFSGELGDLSTAGSLLAQAETVNSPHIILLPRSGNPDLPCVWSAAWCATVCRILADDPAANTYDTTVVGLLGKKSFTATERQKLLEAGIATYRLDSTGRVMVERLVTSYTENTDGGRDTSYLDVQVPETVDAVRTYINAEAKKRYNDWKLSATDENFGSGAKVMQTGIFRSFLCELYSEVFIKEKQWCQDFDNYKKTLIVEKKVGSKTRLEYAHQPNLIGQFYIGAGLLQFK